MIWHKQSYKATKVQCKDSVISCALWRNIELFSSHILIATWKRVKLIGISKVIFMSVPENIHTSTTERFFCFATPLPPENSIVTSYFASKIVASKTPLPPPSKQFPMTFHGVGMDFFLELDILMWMKNNFVVLSCVSRNFLLFSL